MIEKIDKAVDTLNGACSMALVADEQAWAERQKRLERGGSKGICRLGVRAVYNSVRFRPQLVRNMLARPYEKRGVEVIGMGYSSTVVRMGDKALKIIRASERMSEDEQHACVQQFQTSQNLLLEYLEEYAIPQEFKITKHPIKDKNVVVSVQPYIEGFNPLRINNTDGFVGLNKQQKKDVENFTDKSYKMVEETDYVPDMLGADNFGFSKDGNSFLIVDTIPQAVRTPPDMSIEYLDRVAAAVQ